MDNLLDEKEDNLQIDENKDWLSELVGEGKRYATPAELAKSKVFGDRHIAFVEAENAELRKAALQAKEEASTGAKLQELSDRLEAQLQQLASRETTNSNEDKTQPSFKLDDIDSLVETKLQQFERQTKERENYNQVMNKLSEKFGTNYKTVLRERAKSLDLTDDDVNSMARKNPNLFSKTFDLDAPTGETFQAPPKTSSQFSPKPPQKRTWSYYLDLKKKDPNAWLNKDIALQMEKDSQALGQEFFDI